METFPICRSRRPATREEGKARIVRTMTAMTAHCFTVTTFHIKEDTWVFRNVQSYKKGCWCAYVSSKYNALMCNVEYHIDNDTEITVVFYLYNSGILCGYRILSGQLRTLMMIKQQ